MDTQDEIRHVISQIEPFPRLAYEAFERGCEHARWYRDERQKLESEYRLERVLANDLTRSIAKAYLAEHGRLEVEQDFEQYHVANLGLRTQIRGYDIRIWKSPDERIPYPG